MSTEISIHNVGPIHDFCLRLGPPGVYVLRGRNGAGKSSAEAAVAALLGDRSRRLERRDGSARGTVEGAGLALTVGERMRRTGESQEGAEYELSLAEPADGPLAELISPEYKDAAVRNKTRIQAIVKMFGWVASADDLLALVGGQDEALEQAGAAALVGQPLDAAAISLGDLLHGVKRALQQASDEQRARATASQALVEQALGELGEEQPLPVSASRERFAAEAREASRRLGELRILRQQRVALERQQEEIRGASEAPPDLAAAEAQVVAARAAAAAALQEQHRLELLLEGARQQHAACITQLRDSEMQLAADRRRAERWTEQQSILARPVEGPTEAEVAEAEADERAALADAAMAEASQRYHLAKVEVDAATGEAEDLAARAATYEALAKGAVDRLADLFRERDIPGLAVIEGRLHAEVDGELRDFESRLSDGQRVDVALDLAARAYPHKLLVVRDRWWLMLDPDGRAEVAAKIAERGLWALTQEPTRGELRVERLEGEEVAP